MRIHLVAATLLVVEPAVATKGPAFVYEDGQRKEMLAFTFPDRLRATLVFRG